MLFNKYQSKLLQSMLDSIEAYRKGELPYYDLVYSLEGTLDAGEFKNEKMVEQWYSYWTPLEIWSATKVNNVTIEDVNQNLSDMELFLNRLLLEDDN